ncbi:methionine--tRNA ligase [Mycoplasma sp. 1199]|uniref:methionine--tRNA ligase n=1 Tax=Mycoplasma sp. 1199 TaxID=3108526 RepID=UPI002B1E5D51|nr:methionine--tRNA ligase [Mycoplasma sp. 1199]MEA4206270.1 methionine--tRNA ligase [Mycoplasma sp. 1199]
MENKNRNLEENSLGFDAGLVIKQDKDMFNYSVDTIMLGNFIYLNKKSTRALEIGANNGALSIFVASRYDKLKIDAIEIQKKAAELAKENVKLNNMENQIHIINQDFNDFYKQHTKNAQKKYQIIFCNPPFYPYDKTKVKNNISQEKLIATHEIHLNLEQLILGCSKIIEQKGFLSLVLPVERMVDAFELLRKYKFEPKRVQLIYPRIDDKPKFILLEARYQTGWGVHFLPNLYLHDNSDKNNHDYLPEIKKLYRPIKVEEKMNKKTSYITTPIYYASGNLHIGHLYTTTVAWVLANYKKLLGYEVKMLTGSDEHGLKIQQKAAEQNVNPQEFVDNLVAKYKQMWVDFGIEYDFFSRTSSQFHKDSVKHIFSYFLEKGFIYKGQYNGLYSVSDEEFLTETQAVKKEDGYYHPTSGHKLILVSEDSYFFKMNEFAKWLVEYIDGNPEFLAPNKIINEMKNNFLLKGLEDLSVTRTNIDWGIKIDEDQTHTLYVWLDALCNYITALGYDVKNKQQPDEFMKFWASKDSEVVHLIGKEIARFHMIYWPIFLKALNLKQPTRIQAHGWLVTPTGKMSKSKNNVVDPYDLLAKYDKEMIKYYLTSQITLGEDGVWDEDRFIDVINSELINNYGNLVSRTLKMKSNSFSGPLKYKSSKDQNDLDIDLKIRNSIFEYKKHFDNLEIDKALKVAINLSSDLNKYVDLTEPWKLKEDLPRLEQILVRLLNGIYAVSTYLSVVLKDKTKEVATALGFDSFSIDLIEDYQKFDNINQGNEYMLFARLKK